MPKKSISSSRGLRDDKLAPSAARLVVVVGSVTSRTYGPPATAQGILAISLPSVPRLLWPRRLPAVNRLTQAAIIHCGSGANSSGFAASGVLQRHDQSKDPPPCQTRTAAGAVARIGGYLMRPS